MAIVILAEKPSVANDIAKVLGANSKKDTHWQGNDLIVTWAIGHLLQLKYMDDYDPAFKDWRKTVDRLPYIPETFQYKPIGGNGKKQLQAITKLIKDKSITEIVNACDAAREGELIFRTIVAHTKSKVPTSRMWLQSMTKDAIETAFDNRKSGEEYRPLMDAAYARSEADWIIGMNGSRIANQFLPRKRNEKSAISLGRVQTATLAMIVDHELEILSHSPMPYWQLEAQFGAGVAKWPARWERTGHKDDPARPEWKAHRIVEAEEKQKLEAVLAANASANVTQTNRDSHEKPPLNYDLTSLQREANSAFSWSAKRTLSVAQDLYDTYKLTTYPRTDSRHLPEDMHETIAKTIRQLGAQNSYNEFSEHLKNNGLKNVQRNFNDEKVSDHFAIIPTGKLPEDNLRGDHAKLYDLITRTFLASWYPQATWDVQTRTALVGQEKFVKEARGLKTPGWRAVRPKKQDYPEGWNNLPANPCEANVDSHEFKEEKSKPKNRLKEAGLLRLMEHAGKQIDDDELASAMKEKGLGTPATRADTIEKLIDRGYIQRAKAGAINATPHGIRIIDVLRRIPVEWITSAELTGEMESSLSAVQKGTSEKAEYMNLIVDKTQNMVSMIRDHDRAELYSKDEPLGNCPTCDGMIRETTLSYQCDKNEGRDKGCDFVFWKDTSGRWFDRETAMRLIEQKKIEDLHGFFNFSGETYNSTVAINETGQVKSNNSNGVELTGDEAKLCECPVCDHGHIVITATHYSCDYDDCKFRGMSKEMCKRPMSGEEAKKIFTEGKSDLIEDFTSKRGRPFSAYLKLDGNKVSFEFPPRAAPADAKKFAVVPGVVAVCPTHKVNIIETETTYEPESSGSGCNLRLMREISSREITRDEAKTLIEKKEIGPFEDFVSKKTKRNFTAIIYLKRNESIGYKFAKKS